MNEQYKYYAFISYNHKDFYNARDLFRKLEYYKMSSNLCKKHGWTKRKPISPVFFAPYEIQPDELSDELKKRLRESQYLIVVCSPNSAHSKWVRLEIEYFCRDLNRRDKIHFFIIDGEANSDDHTKECYNDAVFGLGLEGKLGVNIHEKVYSWSWLNKERAYVQLITKLLNIEFDAVWQRHKRFILRRLLCYACLSILAAFVFYFGVIPVNVEIAVYKQYEDRLPETEVSKLTVNEKEFINFGVDSIVNIELPGYMRFRKMKIAYDATYYQTIDTIVNITFGIRQLIKVPIERDNTFSVYKGIVINDKRQPVYNCTIQIGNSVTNTDNEGKFAITFPLSEQTATKAISVVHPEYETYKRSDENPSTTMSILLKRKN